MNLVITSEQIVWCLTFIGLVWATVKIIKELKKPSDDLKETVKRHTELLHRDNERCH